MCDREVAQSGEERKMESCTDEGSSAVALIQTRLSDGRIKLMLRTVAFFWTCKGKS